jgi:tRNA(Arg) A34 adenosine deaminase TadA
MANSPEEFLRQAIALAVENVKLGRGGPFGAIVVKDNQVISTGVNLVTSSNDPTAHAEIVAIRAACNILGAFQLAGCEIYTSCEPCPMCLGAIYWSRPNCFYFAGSREEAAEADFDDSFIYDELRHHITALSIPGRRLLPSEGHEPFEIWLRSRQKIRY